MLRLGMRHNAGQGYLVCGVDKQRQRAHCCASANPDHCRLTCHLNYNPPTLFFHASLREATGFGTPRGCWKNRLYDCKITVCSATAYICINLQRAPFAGAS